MNKERYKLKKKMSGREGERWVGRKSMGGRAEVY